MSTSQQLIATIYQAFNARHIDEALVHMHPDVDWPNGMEGGRVIGHEAVRAYWTRQWKMVDPRVDPVKVEAAPDGRIVVDVHQVVRDMAGKILLDQPIRHVYVLSDGLIVRMDIEEMAATG